MKTENVREIVKDLNAFKTLSGFERCIVFTQAYHNIHNGMKKIECAVVCNRDLFLNSDSGNLLDDLLITYNTLIKRTLVINSILADRGYNKELTVEYQYETVLLWQDVYDCIVLSKALNVIDG